MRVLVTGAGGFVGKHLVRALAERGDEAVAVGHPDDLSSRLSVDVTDAAALRDVVAAVEPEAVVHLVAQASVPASLAEPVATADVNDRGTLHMLEALRTTQKRGAGVRLIVVSSAEIYGVQPPSRMPLLETYPPAPANPYAASKAAAEAYAIAYAHSYGIDAVIARPFNHIGPGQDDRFVVGSFARQLAAIANGAPALMLVGNLDARRDFLDVRDVVLAYIALLQHGVAGEAYNVCSGQAVSIKEVLRTLLTIARVPVEIREDSARMRPADVPLLLGDSAKLRAATGWVPRISLAASLRDVYADARARLAA